MLIEDGVLPGNEGRGYVLRRIVRRSIRNLRLLAGASAAAAPSTAAARLHPRADLDRDRGDERAVPRAEPGRGQHPHRRGRRGAAFEQHAADRHRDLRRGGGGEPAPGSSALSGSQAFQLHDTYGFPIDLTLEMAAEQGLTVDEDGFRRLMTEQRERAKEDAAEKKTGNIDIARSRAAGAVGCGDVHRL